MALALAKIKKPKRKLEPYRRAAQQYLTKAVPSRRQALTERYFGTGIPGGQQILETPTVPAFVRKPIDQSRQARFVKKQKEKLEKAADQKDQLYALNKARQLSTKIAAGLAASKSAAANYAAYQALSHTGSAVGGAATAQTGVTAAAPITGVAETGIGTGATTLGTVGSAAGNVHAAALAYLDLKTVKSFDKEGGREYGTRATTAASRFQTAYQWEKTKEKGLEQESDIISTHIGGSPAPAVDYVAEKVFGRELTTMLKTDIVKPARAAVGTVLCTEFNRQGFIPDEILKGDREYAETLPHEVRKGYRMWAEPLTEKVKTSKFLSSLIKPLVKAWAYNMAYKMGRYNKPNLLGEIIEFVGIPICYMLGGVQELNYEKHTY